MKYIKHFSNTTAYEEYINGENPFLPNASFIKQTHINKYNRWVDLFHVICKFNVSTTTAATRINNAAALFNELIIDDVERASIPTGWTFSTAGEHDVRYNLKAQATLGDNAFSGCTRLTECTAPSAVTTVASKAFYGCSMLKNVNLPNTLTTINGSAFHTCSALTRINSDVEGTFNIPSGVTHFNGANTFYRCYKLVNLKLSDEFSGFSQADFQECSNLSTINSEIEGEVNIPSGVTSLAYSLFNSDTKIKNINLPSGLTSIGQSTLYGCTGLTRINSEIEGEFNIPSGVTSIGHNAFNNCKGAVSVSLPTENFTTLNNAVFSGCTNLIRVNSDTDGVFNIPSGLTGAMGSYAFGSTKVTKAVIPTGVTEVRGFDSCTGLTSVGLVGSDASVEIPNSVTVLGGFYGCSKITDVNMPNTVTSIGSQGFQGCSSLSAITLSTALTSIGASAFTNCSSISSVTIPNTVTSIGANGFQGCSNLTAVTIPSGVTTIPNNLFYNCTKLSRLNSDTEGVANIPSGITSIGGHAFRGITGITSVQIPSGVTSIGGAAFYQSGKITSITFSNGSVLTAIGGDAFNSCTGLTSLEIPSSVTSFGNYSFYNCNHLTSITMSNSVTSLNYTAIFRGCTALKRFNSDTDGVFNLPTGLTGTIGAYAFYSCSAMTSVVVPEGVTGIGSECFRQCGNLLTVVLPSTLTNIASSANFYDCKKLTSITINATNPPTLGHSNAFTNTNNCDIYVPATSVDAYKAATNWSAYASRIEAIPT